MVSVQISPTILIQFRCEQYLAKLITMKKLLILLFLLQINKFGLTQTSSPNDSLIEWTSHGKLIWEDFQGKPKKDPKNMVAVTQAVIKIIEVFWTNDTVPTYKLQCYFVKNKSWTIVEDNETLKHEQIHFNICELVARKLRKAFTQLNEELESDTQVYDRKYYELIEYLNGIQNQYDSETYFNTKKQNEWKIKIERELKSLDKYRFVSKNEQ